MTLHVMTTQEKLDEVERLIRDLRSVRDSHSCEALKAVASDLRARLAFAPSAALVDIERRVVAVARSKSRTGYDPAKLHVLGEGVAVHWPVLKQALERFGAEIAP